MTNLMIFFELLTKILDQIPNASDRMRIELLAAKRRYAEELSIPKDERDDAKIDELREKLIRLTEYAIDLLNSKKFFSVANDDNNG